MTYLVSLNGLPTHPSGAKGAKSAPIEHPTPKEQTGYEGNEPWNHAEREEKMVD